MMIIIIIIIINHTFDKRFNLGQTTTTKRAAASLTITIRMSSRLTLIINGSRRVSVLLLHTVRNSRVTRTITNALGRRLHDVLYGIRYTFFYVDGCDSFGFSFLYV